jgi:prepilin-type N-terminal cleavage/methylation domain-containing protein
MSRRFNKQGFTLIEIIVSLLLIGVVAAVVSLYSVNMANSFISARTNAATLQKGQIAIARIIKELNNVKTVYVDPAMTNGTRITFTSYKDAVAVNHTISWGGSGTNLLLDGITLTDKVSSFALAYYDNYDGSGAQPTWQATSRIIEINLVITGWENITSAFNARVAPSFDILIGT